MKFNMLFIMLDLRFIKKVKVKSCKLIGIHRYIIIKYIKDNHKLLSDKTSPVIPKCYWTIVRRERKIFTGRFPSGISLRPILPPGTDRLR